MELTNHDNNQLQIALKVNSTSNDEDSVIKAKTEIRKLMDLIWQHYPKAQVAKTKTSDKGSSILFEVI